MYKLIIFDLGKVMLDFDHMDSCRGLAEFSRYSPVEIYEGIFISGLEEEYDKGRISSLNFYREVLRRFEIDESNINFEYFKKVWGDIFFEVPSMRRLMETLKKNYHVYLLSNTNEIHFEWAYNKFDILKIPEEHILSYKLGFRKPDKRIFYEAINKADVSPKDCIYIDDRKEYAEVAESIGMVGIHFSSKEQLEERIKGLGVKY
ncbi:MAG: HAD family phosphatase [bacterium]|nr:HAD family phosphatase [bacterium]